jgi:predicted amidohydrolase YtcJ
LKGKRYHYSTLNIPDDGTVGSRTAAMFEDDQGEPDAGIQPLESERPSVESLLKGFTIDAPYQLPMEDEIDSIQVGKKAGLVVLDQDMFFVDRYSIHDTEVALTVMDGNIVYAQ